MSADEKPSCECKLAKVSSWSTLCCIQMQADHLCLLFSSLFWKFLPTTIIIVNACTRQTKLTSTHRGVSTAKIIIGKKTTRQKAFSHQMWRIGANESHMNLTIQTHLTLWAYSAHNSHNKMDGNHLIHLVST